MRLKDVEPIIRELQDEEEYGADYYFPIELLKSAPTIEAKLVVHAHWEDDEDGEPHCSNCGGLANLDSDEFMYRDKIRYIKTNFCPNCGAQMDEVKE